MIDKRYRYRSIVDGQVISECDFLLGISNTVGQIWDDYQSCFIEPIKHTFLLPDCYLLEYNDFYKISEYLAKIESENKPIKLGTTEPELLVKVCLNPQIEIGDVNE